MPKTYICPFWMWERGRAIRCERCRMDFPDECAKREYAERYCASLDGWQECSIAKALLKFYERTDGDAETKRGQDQRPGT